MALQSSVEFFSTRNFNRVTLSAAQKGVLEFAIRMTANAKTLGAVNDTGLLNNSKQYITGDNKAGGLNSDGSNKQANKLTFQLKPNEAVVGSTADYAVYQEFGTRKMAPKPFLRPAAALTKGQDAQNVIRKINDEMARGGLREGQQRETFI